MKSRLALVLVSTPILLTMGCGPKRAVLDTAELSVFAPLPENMESPINAATDAKVNLGRMLYYEPRLSKNQQISCNSCHDLTKYGVDGQPVSTGHKGQHGNRNAPTVYNAAAHFVQFWDGRAPSVEEQAKGPVMNPVEMAMASPEQVVAVVKSMPEYVQAFEKAFPGDKNPATFENMALAIGAFERKLLTPARWDKFLKGDQAALTDAEKAGLHTFVTSGCQNCHSGPLLGGNIYQKLGTMRPWTDDSDLGRYKITQNVGDKLMFKVPSLRNIEKTGPYFHDGKVPTLKDAIAKMADHQLGVNLTDTEVQSIETWMKSVTGELPAEYIKKPELPKSTSATPQPSAI